VRRDPFFKKIEEVSMLKGAKILRKLLVLLFVSICFLAWGSPASGQSQRGELLTLQEAVQMALDGNSSLRAARAAQEVAAAGLQEAESGRLPRLSFNETYTHSNNPVFVFGSLLEQGRFGTENFRPEFLNSPGSYSNFRSSLQLQLPIFNRFQVASLIDKARIGTQQAEALTEMANQRVRYRVIETYFGVFVAKEQKEVADEAVQTAQAELQRIRDLSSQGMVVASDLLAMEVQLAEFQQQLVQAQGNINIAYAALSAMLGQPIDVATELSGELVDRAFPLPTPMELIQSALQFRPDYLSAGMEIKSRDQDIRKSKGEFWPDLNLFAEYGRSSQNLTSGSSDFAVGARLTLNIVDFGRTPRRKRVEAAKRAAEAAQQSKVDEIRLEVVQAHESVQAAQKNIVFAEAAVNQATETVRIIQDRYEVELTTITEVLRSQTTLVRARLSLLLARYDYYLGYARTRLAAGTLDDVIEFVR
jgi:outer membrane protein TolC